jgi:hypothetical protein
VQKLDVNNYVYTVEIGVLSWPRFESYIAHIFYKFWVAASESISVGAIPEWDEFPYYPCASNPGLTVGFRTTRNKKGRPRDFPGPPY